METNKQMAQNAPSNDDWEELDCGGTEDECPACGAPLTDCGGYKICSDDDCHYVDI